MASVKFTQRLLDETKEKYHFSQNKKIEGEV